jgi:NAD-dependent SIR2 family protein deacetylase
VWACGRDQEEDLPLADLVLILGTSLKVQPFASLKDEVTGIELSRNIIVAILVIVVGVIVIKRS